MSKKLNLESFKVQSFVTDMKNEDKRTVNGGDKLTFKGCDSLQFGCGSEYPDTKYWNGPCWNNTLWCVD